MPSRIEAFRKSLVTGRRLVGLFTRLTDPTVIEILAATALDFAVLDVEHGSLDRQQIDRIVFAARAGDLPLMVRVPDSSVAPIQHALAVGAAGVIVPHVTSGEEARAVAAFVRTAALERTFAGVGRATDHRRRAWPEFHSSERERLAVIVQVDEWAGAEGIEQIAQAPGVDAVFIGSLSLAFALGATSPHDPAAERVFVDICAVCQRADRRVGMHLQHPDAEPVWAQRGVNLFVAGNDLGLLLNGAEQILTRFGRSPAGR